VLAGRDASEAALKAADLRRYGVLHLAAHAVVDEERPERSAILLGPGAAAEDGLLQMREIVALRLADPLVVLSACRTAAGTVLEGEGVLGLARAFFQGGARTVVGSLWPLRDDEAERLFAAFYRRLAEGRSVAEALAEAKRERMRRGDPAAAWAGPVVLGDGDARPLRPAAR
jgi:CHAT domain-containing protein